MKTSVEPLEGNKVKVSVEVPETEFEAEIDAAFRRLARQVRIPGFRPGKAPRRILEARLGNDVAREEALRHAVPEYYAKAVRDEDVDVIAPPELEIKGGADEGPVQFDAVVEVRPVVTIGGYKSLRVTVAAPDPTPEEIDHQIDHLREQFADLKTVDRPAADGDYVRIDISGSQEGEPVAGLTAEDYLYAVGSGSVVPELDENLRGTKAGDELSFVAEHPHPDEAPVSFAISVKEVKEKVLPEPTDEWAAEASEFDTLDELRADIEKRQRITRRIQGQMAIREKTGEALAQLVDEELPDALVNGELRQRLEDLTLRLRAQGMSLEQYLASSGTTVEQLQDDLRQAAEQAVKVDLALRAIVAADGIEVTDEELEQELESLSQRVGETVDNVRQRLEEAGQVSSVRADIAKRKALEQVVETVEIVDEEGNPLQRSDFELDGLVGTPPAADEDGEPASANEDAGESRDDESSVAAPAGTGSVGEADSDPAASGEDE